MKTKTCTFCNRNTKKPIEFQRGFKVEASCKKCWPKFGAGFTRIVTMTESELSAKMTKLLSEVL